MSDEDFVNRSIELLIKYCESCGLSDIEGANIDGSDDGGIDGVLLGCFGIPVLFKEFFNHFKQQIFFTIRFVFYKALNYRTYRVS